MSAKRRTMSGGAGRMNGLMSKRTADSYHTATTATRPTVGSSAPAIHDRPPGAFSVPLDAVKSGRPAGGRWWTR